MPDLDGVGLYRCLQHSHAYLLDRVVFMTGDTLGMGGSDYLARTGCPVLEKPFVPGEFFRVIGETLQQCDTRRRARV